MGRRSSNSFVPREPTTRLVFQQRRVKPTKTGEIDSALQAIMPQRLGEQSPAAYDTLDQTTGSIEKYNIEPRHIYLLDERGF